VLAQGGEGAGVAGLEGRALVGISAEPVEVAGEAEPCALTLAMPRCALPS